MRLVRNSQLQVTALLSVIFMKIYKKMKIPKINLKELKKDIKKNEKERLEFIDRYVEWLKKTPNKKWSKIHAKFLI